MTLLNLVVLRVPDIELGAEFYTQLGLTFTKHSHGKGPEHYAVDINNVVFELYPQIEVEKSTSNVRIGFQVTNALATIAKLIENGGKIVSPLKESPWGLRAVMEDPFGHRIELTEAKK